MNTIKIKSVGDVRLDGQLNLEITVETDNGPSLLKLAPSTASDFRTALDKVPAGIQSVSPLTKL